MLGLILHFSCVGCCFWDSKWLAVMKLFLMNTKLGLIPLYDEDHDEKKKLKIGERYRADIVVPRNIEFHRKYFALLNCAWEYQNEKRQEFFKNNVELFREAVEIAAGNTEQFYSIDRKEWLERKKSISFGSMKAEEFNDLYDRVKIVLFSIFLNHIDEKEFTVNLINF